MKINKSHAHLLKFSKQFPQTISWLHHNVVWYSVDLELKGKAVGQLTAGHTCQQMISLLGILANFGARLNEKLLASAMDIGKDYVLSCKSRL